MSETKKDTTMPEKKRRIRKKDREAVDPQTAVDILTSAIEILVVSGFKVEFAVNASAPSVILAIPDVTIVGLNDSGFYEFALAEDVGMCGVDNAIEEPDITVLIPVTNFK